MDTVNKIVAVSNIGTSYVVILLKVIGICIITEFAVNTCKDAGSLALSNNVSLAGKIMVTITALQWYFEYGDVDCRDLKNHQSGIFGILQ